MLAPATGCRRAALLTLLALGALLWLLTAAPAWADISVERGPNSDRGSVAGAVVLWVVAGVVVATIMRRGLGRSGTARGASSRAAQAAPSRLLAAGQVALGIGLMLGLTAVARWTVPDPALPAGWSIVRPPHDVDALAFQGDTVWTGGRDGMVAIDRATGRLLPPRAGAPRFGAINALLVDPAGQLWVAHADGLTRFDGTAWTGTAWTRPGSTDSVPAGAAGGLLAARDGSVWAGFNGAVVHFAGTGPEVFTTHDGLSNRLITTIVEDRDGALWFGSGDPSADRLARFDGVTWRSFAAGEGIVHASINDAWVDRRGALWFATGFSADGAASRLMAGEWQPWTRHEGMPAGKVRSVFEDSAGRYWFGSESNGTSVYDPASATWRLLTPAEGVPGWEVKQVREDPAGVLWLATEDGVGRLEPGAALPPAAAPAAMDRPRAPTAGN